MEFLGGFYADRSFWYGWCRWLFWGRLAQAGEEVIFIACGKHLQALHSHGLKVDSINGDFVIDSVQATDNPGEVGVVDMVLIGVKAWQVVQLQCSGYYGGSSFRVGGTET